MAMKDTAADLENVATRALAAAKPAAINRQFLSPVEAETLTGISRWTWRSKAYSGEIASSKVGRRLLLPIAEIDRIIAEGARLPRTTPQREVKQRTAVTQRVAPAGDGR